MNAHLLQTLLPLNLRRDSSPSILPHYSAANRRSPCALRFSPLQSTSIPMASLGSSVSIGRSCINKPVSAELRDFDMDQFIELGNKLADASGVVIRQYFRRSFNVTDKEDLSPVTIADQEAEAAMVKIIQEHYPHHAIYGEEDGWRCKEEAADFVWVLDPIDGTKSFITGKPLFGTLIALLHKGEPILGIVDQPVLQERWIGVQGRRTIFNGQEIFTRDCPQLSKAYLFTTSPHLFSGDAEAAFSRVRNKVKVPLYGCDCYAYALLAMGHVDIVVESGLKPYDFLALIPVIEGAGGFITDWNGKSLSWEPSANKPASSFNVLAAGDKKIHVEAINSLQWN